MPRAVFAIVLLWAAGGPASAAIVYDKPLSTETITAPGPSWRGNVTYTCWHYPLFTVKQEIYGKEPSGAFSIEPGNSKRCEVRGTNGRHLAYGVRHGVKGRFLTILPEAKDQALSYIYLVDSQAKQRWAIALGGDSNGHLETPVFSSDAVTLRYQRVYMARCSIFYGPLTACWTSIKADTGLTDDMAPDCRPAYEARRKKDGATGEKFNLRSSQITYRVEARFSGGKLTFAPLPGPVTCKPGY